MGIKGPSHKVTKTKRWQALRIQALRRDDFQCLQCGARGRLEVDHIEPVRENPDKSFTLDNLQTLCPSCHSQKTREEMDLPPVDKNRKDWRELLARSPFVLLLLLWF